MNGIALGIFAAAFSFYSMWAGVEPGWFHMLFANLLICVLTGICWFHHKRIEYLEGYDYDEDEE